MAIFHCSCKVISRSSGSSVGASAYRSGTAMTNEWNGEKHDYTLKGSTGQVVHSEVMLCKNAPEEYQNRETLWNAVEKGERSSDAQLSREFEFALPRELSREEQIAFTREFVRANFVEKGMCADINIHDKGDGNPHAHIMTTMRPIDENGKWEKKTEQLYLCKNKAGEERAFTPNELAKDENSEWMKQHRYSKNGNPNGKKIWLTEYEKENNPKYKNFERIKNDRQPKTEKFGKQNATMKEWNSKEFLERVRENLAVSINKELERKGLPQKVDHRSYEKQGIDKIPTIHEGKSARQREDKRTNPKYKGKYKDRYKEPTEKIETNREIKKANEELKEVKKEIYDTQRAIQTIQSDMAWSRFHESCATLERYIKQNSNSEEAQNYALEQMKKLEATLDKLTAVEQKMKLHADKFYGADDKKISYLDFHRDKAISDFEYLNAHITKNIAEIEMAKEPPVAEVEISKETAMQQHQPEQVHADPKQVSEAQTVPFDVESIAKQLEEHRGVFIRATIQSQDRTFYQENPIYERQAVEVAEISKAYKEQTSAKESLQEQRANLKPFQFKDKKNLDNKILNFELLCRDSADKLKAYGISDPAKADDKVQELKFLAQQEKVKAQTAKENAGAGARATEAQNAFISLAQTVPENMKQAVQEKMEQFRGKKSHGNLSVFQMYQGEKVAKDKLDVHLKPKQEQERPRSREQTKNKDGRGYGE